MLSNPVVVVAALLWLGMLFGAALWAERRPHLLARHWPIVYSLSLAVYCTSWTFYGTVTQAQRSGWPIPPTFIGTILLYAVRLRLPAQAARASRANRTRPRWPIWWRPGWARIRPSPPRSPGGAARHHSLHRAAAQGRDHELRAAHERPCRRRRRRGRTARSTSRCRWRCSRCCSVPAARRSRNTIAAWSSRWRWSPCSSWSRCWRWELFVWTGAWHLPDAAAAGAAPMAPVDFPALILLGALAMFTLAAPVPCRRGRMSRRTPPAHRALAVPAVHAADRAADPAAGARAGDALAGRRSGVPSDLLRAGAAAFAGPRAVGVARLPRRPERRHRHGDPGHAGAQRDDRQPLAGAVAGARPVGVATRRGRRPARRGADAASRRHPRRGAAGVAVQPRDRRQRRAGRHRRGVVLGAGHARSRRGLRRLAAARSRIYSVAAMPPVTTVICGRRC